MNNKYVLITVTHAGYMAIVRGPKVEGFIL